MTCRPGDPILRRHRELSREGRDAAERAAEIPFVSDERSGTERRLIQRVRDVPPSADAWIERHASEGVRLRVVGMLKFADHVDPELADRVIESISVRGMLRGPQVVLNRLASKTDRGAARRQ